MRTIIPKIFSQTTKFGNLITFLFQGVYPQGKTGLISQHLCMRMSIIVFIGLLLYINFALNLNFLLFFSMILTLISPFSFKNNVRHHTVNFLKSCKPPRKYWHPRGKDFIAPDKVRRLQTEHTAFVNLETLKKVCTFVQSFSNKVRLASQIYWDIGFYVSCIE